MSAAVNITTVSQAFTIAPWCLRTALSLLESLPILASESGWVSTVPLSNWKMKCSKTLRINVRLGFANQLNL